MNVKDLFDWYNDKRNTNLELDDFSSLLMMFPSVLVASADGDFDSLEKQNLANACYGLEVEPYITCEMYSELCFLAKSEDEDILNNIFSCIKAESKDNNEAQLIVIELMIQMAQASDGISEEESSKIKEIKQILEY
jgi:tellurite resistance protein